MRKLIFVSLLALSTCGQSPDQIRSMFACATDASGAIVSVVDTTKAPTMTTAQKVLTGVGTLTAVGATDPNCANAIVAIATSKK